MAVRAICLKLCCGMAEKRKLRGTALLIYRQKTAPR
jgi:hypothetical protein